ncbi:MAG: hypothetical protein ABMA64_01595 [Myxococcota bacterium]
MNICPACGTHRRAGACPHCGSERPTSSFGAAAAVLGLLFAGCGDPASVTAAEAAPRAVAGGSYVDALTVGGTAYGLTFTDSADSGTPTGPTDTAADTAVETDTDTDADTDADTDTDADADTDADTDADADTDTADTGGGKAGGCACDAPASPAVGWLGGALAAAVGARRTRRTR